VPGTPLTNRFNYALASCGSEVHERMGTYTEPSLIADSALGNVENCNNSLEQSLTLSVSVSYDRGATVNAPQLNLEITAGVGNKDVGFIELQLGASGIANILDADRPSSTRWDLGKEKSIVQNVTAAPCSAFQYRACAFEQKMTMDLAADIIASGQAHCGPGYTLAPGEPETVQVVFADESISIDFTDVIAPGIYTEEIRCLAPDCDFENPGIGDGYAPGEVYECEDAMPWKIFPDSPIFLQSELERSEREKRCSDQDEPGECVNLWMDTLLSLPDVYLGDSATGVVFSEGGA